MKRNRLSFVFYLIPTLKAILEMHACAFFHTSLSQHSIVQYPFWHVGCNALLRSPVLLAHFLLHRNCQMTVHLPVVTHPAGWLAHPSFPLSSTRGCVSRQDMGGDGSAAQLQNQECKTECMRLILVEFKLWLSS